VGGFPARSAGGRLVLLTTGDHDFLTPPSPDDTCWSAAKARACLPTYMTADIRLRFR
jgi:hypothetical protein